MQCHVIWSQKAFTQWKQKKKSSGKNNQKNNVQKLKWTGSHGSFCWLGRMFLFPDGRKKGQGQQKSSTPHLIPSYEALWNSTLGMELGFSGWRIFQADPHSIRKKISIFSVCGDNAYKNQPWKPESIGFIQWCAPVHKLLEESLSCLSFFLFLGGIKE